MLYNIREEGKKLIYEPTEEVNDLRSFVRFSIGVYRQAASGHEKDGETEYSMVVNDRLLDKLTKEMDQVINEVKSLAIDRVKEENDKSFRGFMKKNFVRPLYEVKKSFNSMSLTISAYEMQIIIAGIDEMNKGIELVDHQVRRKDGAVESYGVGEVGHNKMFSFLGFYTDDKKYFTN